MPKVLNRKLGWPEGAVYIGRPSKWGNPFVIGKDGSRDEVILRYFEYLRTRQDLIDDLDELNGCDLLCWCAPQFCHGDVLLALAEASAEERTQILKNGFV